MSHFAQLDAEGVVQQVIVAEWDFIQSGVLPGTWVATSYNAAFGGKFAAIGDTYDFATGLFISPKPYDSWVKQGSYWVPPVPCPSDGKSYTWDESVVAWTPFNGN